MSDKTALTVREEYGMIDPAQVTQVIAANLGTGGINLFDLDILHVPTSGSAWELPALEGTESVKAIRGIIVTWRELRRYYKDTYKAGVKEPPTCSSMDMINGSIPFDDELGCGGPCGQCPMNQFGTSTAQGGGPGRGKACSQYRYLFVMVPGRILPLVVAVPPTSLTAVRKYMMQLTSYNRTFFSVVTELTLERGEPVPTIGFKAIKQIDATELQSMAAYFAEMRRVFADVALETDKE